MVSLTEIEDQIKRLLQDKGPLSIEEITEAMALRNDHIVQKLIEVVIHGMTKKYELRIFYADGFGVCPQGKPFKEIDRHTWPGVVACDCEIGTCEGAEPDYPEEFPGMSFEAFSKWFDGVRNPAYITEEKLREVYGAIVEIGKIR